jgi:hypothetical protein
MTLHHTGINTHLRTHKRARAHTHTHALKHELLNLLKYHLSLSLSVHAYIVFRHIVSFNIKPQVECAVKTQRYFQQRPRFCCNGFCRTDFVAVDCVSRLSFCNLACSGDEICNLYTTCLKGCPISAIPFAAKRERDTRFHLLQNATVNNLIDCKTRYAISKSILASCYQYSMIDWKTRLFAWHMPLTTRVPACIWQWMIAHS